jgi:hypothetical protein
MAGHFCACCYGRTSEGIAALPNNCHHTLEEKIRQSKPSWSPRSGNEVVGFANIAAVYVIPGVSQDSIQHDHLVRATAQGTSMQPAHAVFSSIALRLWEQGARLTLSC